MKNTTIDASLLPHMWLTWATTKEVFYLDCNTGVKQSEVPECARRYSGTERCVCSGSKPRFAYAKYHEDIDALEMAEVTIDTTRKPEVKQWKYVGEKYFLKKDKTVYDADGNVKTNNFVLSQYHRSNDFKGFLGFFYRIDIPSNVTEFKKLLGSDKYTVGSGRVVNVTSCWHIQEWYKTKQKVRGKGKQQKLTDNLVEMPVRDITEISNEYNSSGRTDNRYWSPSGIIYFERLSGGWSVLRVLQYPSVKNNFVEVERMYLHDDGASRIVAPSIDGWIPARQRYTYGDYNFANKDDAINNCNRLKYILPLISDETDRYLRNSLITILRFPEVEQMIKLGYKEAARYITHSNVPHADLKYLFGGYYNDKETSLLRKAGMTKHQMDKYMLTLRKQNQFAKCSRAMTEMRKFFGNNLLHLDSASFDKYFDAFISMDRGWGRKAFSYIDDMEIDRTKFIKNAVRLAEKSSNVYTVLDDTLSRYTSLNFGTRPEINWYFDSYSDLIRAHNAIDELKRAQDAERRAMWDVEAAKRRQKEEEKRIKLDQERKKYEYEDDNYVIRLPKDSNEIIREGDKQRICIGGYTRHHALGETNLFFLRCKSEPDAPFYAIEMNSSKRIVQIHGYCNRWLGNNPEAIPTVIRWLRNNGIKCDNKILTCTATGYCSTNNYVPMPVVD